MTSDIQHYRDVVRLTVTRGNLADGDALPAGLGEMAGRVPRP